VTWVGGKIAEPAGACPAEIACLLEEAGFAFRGAAQEAGEGEAAELRAGGATGTRLGGQPGGEFFIQFEGERNHEPQCNT